VKLSHNPLSLLLSGIVTLAAILPSSVRAFSFVLQGSIGGDAGFQDAVGFLVVDLDGDGINLSALEQIDSSGTIVVAQSALDDGPTPRTVCAGSGSTAPAMYKSFLVG